MIRLYFDESVEEALLRLGTTLKGLSGAEVQSRLGTYGPNALTAKKKISALKIFLAQFKNLVVWVLLFALFISVIVPLYEKGFRGAHPADFLDAIVILIIVLLNAILGFVQEFRAERAIDALKKMGTLKARVIRDGKTREIDAHSLVPGDIILLEDGNKIPADCRIIEAMNLETQEATLTGESTSVAKQAEKVPADTILAERTNMTYSGTIVTRGRAKLVVASTGMETEIGRIATLLEEVEAQQTPMQEKLHHLGKFLAGVVAVLCIIILIVGRLRGGGSFIELFILAVSLAVAAIPEGLPAVVTIALALGVQRMAKRHALMRKLSSAETLGSTTAICTDKTGTLTCNEMTVKRLYVNNRIIDVSGSGYQRKGVFSDGGKIVHASSFSFLLELGALCNDAHLDGATLLGDPTEIALLVAGEKAGIIKKDLEKNKPRINELGFDSSRKRMSTLHKDGKKNVLCCKGAPDLVIELCDRIWINGDIKRLAREDKKQILAQNELFARQALRVLAFAYKEGSAMTEDSLIFVGLQAMIDPPRPEAKDAIAECKRAGIKVIMITGDFELTAKAIAKELGIEGKSINGKELDKVKSIDTLVEDVVIYARANPEHKLRIVEALQRKGHIVAMTGDGANDAPALKRADIGIAMGIKGTDVAKEASDMILTDDNFASIVHAVEEGRGVYDNIQKFIFFLLSSNFGEVLTVFIGILLFVGTDGKALVPLLALHILWMNLITDGLPALALSVDPYGKNIMEHKPRDPHARIITKTIFFKMLFVGAIMTAGTLLVFNYYLPDIVYARTMAFTTLVMYQMFNVFNSRSLRQSIFKLQTNFSVLGAVLVSIVMQLAVLYTPLSQYFNVVPLGALDWVYVVSVSASILVIMEVVKMMK